MSFLHNTIYNNNANTLLLNNLLHCGTNLKYQYYFETNVSGIIPPSSAGDSSKDSQADIMSGSHISLNDNVLGLD